MNTGAISQKTAFLEANCRTRVVSGALTVIVWVAMGWNSSFLGGPGVYEMIRGFLLAMLVIVVVSLVTDAKGEFRAIGSA